MREVTDLLRESIRYGLEHRQEALHYAEKYGRDLDHQRTDTFVGMYVNDWTIDFGPRGREAVETLLQAGPTKPRASFPGRWKSNLSDVP